MRSNNRVGIILIILALKSMGAPAAPLLMGASYNLAQTFSKGSPRLPLKYPQGVLDE
jgi:hypothetical protein